MKLLKFILAIILLILILPIVLSLTRECFTPCDEDGVCGPTEVSLACHVDCYDNCLTATDLAQTAKDSIVNGLHDACKQEANNLPLRCKAEWDTRPTSCRLIYIYEDGETEQGSVLTVDDLLDDNNLPEGWTRMNVPLGKEEDLVEKTNNLLEGYYNVRYIYDDIIRCFDCTCLWEGNGSVPEFSTIGAIMSIIIIALGVLLIVKRK